MPVSESTAPSVTRAVSEAEDFLFINGMGLMAMGFRQFDVRIGTGGSIGRIKWSISSLGRGSALRAIARFSQPIEPRTLQQMTKLHLLGRKIFFVVGIRLGPNRHLLDHFQTVTLQTHNFLRIVG